MAAKILAIIGTYRKGRVIDAAVSEVLKGAEAHGAETSKIYLIDKHIEFCTNCRKCAQQKDVGVRARCVHDDDMEAILRQIDNADGLVLASPVNFGNVTAVTKRFIERLIVYGYWPWGGKMPKLRIEKPEKKAVTVTASACPAFIARILMPGPLKVLKSAARCMGATVSKSLYFGAVAQTEDATLDGKGLLKAYKAGEKLACRAAGQVAR
jgi:putative NADPH-quinone reductase